MTLWQVLKQVKYLLQELTWPGTSNKVFGPSSVIVTSGVSLEQFQEMNFPVVLISSGGDAEHEEHPDLEEFNLELGVWVYDESDTHGELGVLGRDPTLTDSTHRGVLEVINAVTSQLNSLMFGEGVRFFLAGKSKPSPERRLLVPALVKQQLSYSGHCGSAKSYWDPNRVAVADLTGGSAQYSIGSFPPDRFDLEGVRITRVAGSGAVLPTDTLVADDVTTSPGTDSPGAGTFTYGFFGKYEDGSFSPGRSVTVVVT